MPHAELAQRISSRLDLTGGEPVSTQIVEHLWVEVIDGSLETGSRLPTARHLAIDLGVSPRTVERAYEDLEKMGVATTRAGHGTFVSLTLPSEGYRERRRAFSRLCSETVDRARDLGFSVHELVEELSEYRTLERSEGTEEPVTP